MKLIRTLLQPHSVFIATALVMALSVHSPRAQAFDAVSHPSARDEAQDSLLHFDRSRHKILFTLKDGDTNKVALMNADGTQLKELAVCGLGECSPNWSPDGMNIVFERHDHNGAAIYIMRHDGTGQRRLSPIPGFDVRPDFSPDGTEIIFNHVVSRNMRGENEVPETEIMIMDIAGESRRTVLPADGAFNVEPRISPDGRKIVFMSSRDKSQQIYVMNIDGTGLKKITDEGSNGDPVWSRDGSRISFGSNREGDGKLNIFSMNPDGSDIRQLTRFSPPFEAGDTSWSPDGKVIAFEVDIDGKGQSDPSVPAEIWLVSANGQGQPVSTRQSCAAVGCAPRFQP